MQPFSSDVCPKIFNIEKYKIVDNLNGEATVTLLIAHLIKQKSFISKNPTLLFKKRLSWSCISVLGFKKKEFFFLAWLIPTTCCFQSDCLHEVGIIDTYDFDDGALANWSKNAYFLFV